MEAPESFRRYPSGQENLSLDFSNIYHNHDGDDDCECPHPCCSKRIAMVWQGERDQCAGKMFGCAHGDMILAPLGGLLLRCLHVVACASNVTAAVAGTTICCCAHTGIAVETCCKAMCRRVCGREALSEQERANALAANAVALKRLKHCSTWSLTLMGTALVETVSLPFNVACPEICNLFCYQQERNLWLNRQLKDDPCFCGGNRYEDHVRLQEPI